MRGFLWCFGAVVVLRRTFDRLVRFFVVLSAFAGPHSCLSLGIVIRNILLCGWAICSRGVTAACKTREIFSGWLRDILFDGCTTSVLSIIIVVIVIIVVIIIIIIVDGRCSSGRLIRYVIICTLNIIVISLVVCVIVWLVIGARLQGCGLRELSAVIIILIVILIIASRLHRGTLTEATGILLIVIGIGVVSVVNSRFGRRARRLEVVIILIIGAGPVRRRRRVISLRILLIPVEIL